LRRRSSSSPRRGWQGSSWLMAWVVIGAGVAAAALLPVGVACTETNEFNCGSGFLIRIGILLVTAIVAGILFIAAW